MKISFTGVALHNNNSFNTQQNGYARVARQIYNSLERHGFEVVINDPTAEINICCDNPGWLRRQPNQYNIGIATHESTEIIPEWQDGLNLMDEIWTTATWVKEDCFDKYTDRVTLVVRACITDGFDPVERVKDGPFYFLHTGEPTLRKNGRLVLEAFLQEFEDDSNAFLVFKSYGPASITGIQLYDRVTVIASALEQEDYKNLLYNTHCLVYPSMGEGGGMMPLEAMATGMPVISVTDWADYAEYIHAKLHTRKEAVPQNIQEVSFLRGEAFQPTIKSIRDQMRRVYNNYSDYELDYREQAIKLKEEFNWDREVETRVIPRLREIEKTLK